MNDPKSLFRRVKLALAAAAFIGLTGCESLEGLMPEMAGPKTPPAKRLKLQAIDHAHWVTFPERRSDLMVSEAERLNSFLMHRARAARYTIYVAPDRTAPAALGEGRGETVAAYLESQGFHTRLLPETATADGAGRVRVVVRSFTITLPGCPDWTSDPSHSFDNTVHSNWGCASATNLGLMVADPGDLARGRPAGPADAELLSKRIRDYRKGETKPLDPEDVGTTQSQQKSGSGGGGGSQ